MLALGGCGGGRIVGAGRVTRLGDAARGVSVTPRVSLRAGGALSRAGGSSAHSMLAVRLDGPEAPVVSFDVSLAPASRLRVGRGSSPSFTLSRSAGLGATRVAYGGRSATLSVPPGWLGGPWHVEWVADRLAIDGRLFTVAAGRGSRLQLRAQRGRSNLSALIVSSAADRGALLLHRLAELHARIPPRQFPVGTDLSDRIHYDSTYWTSGFWPGALWQAAALAPAGGMFARWAMTATVEHFGQEHRGTHDLGFEYGESSLSAWRSRCRPTRRPISGKQCLRLKNSVLAAANELLKLAATNPAAGAIPTNATSGDTIVDSMMNIAILPWASLVTANPVYRRLASRHAHVVASLLVRRDGSTAQSVTFERRSGKVLLISTHQGLSNSSTWSRGQGWAVYGFAQAAADLHDRSLLRVALRAARYVAAHLPGGGIPRWDYDAPPSAPLDVSAGVITAAGLFHLAVSCRALPGVCGAPSVWMALGRRMLAASLTRAYARPPIGFLGSQVLNERGRGCWCDGGELSFGLTYALEALNLERRADG